MKKNDPKKSSLNIKNEQKMLKMECMPYTIKNNALKKDKSKIVRIALFLCALLMINANVFATSYTAVTSGAWSSITTWGGPAPVTMNTTDQVTIPATVTVTMDNDVTLNGVTSQLNVQGTLSGNLYTLAVVSGTVTGTGTIHTDSLTLGIFSTLNFTGSYVANAVVSSSASVQMSANMTINQALTVTAGMFSVQAVGTLTATSGATLTFAGGQLNVLSGGTLGLSSTYNVVYNSSSINAGLELSGTGLNDVTVNVGSLNNVTLTSDVTVNGMLNVMTGTMIIGTHHLTVNGAFTAAAGTSFSSTAGSMSVNSSGGVSGMINFTALSTVNNLTVNVGVGSQVAISGTLTVTGTTNIVVGVLDFSGANLTLSGALSGGGSLRANGSSNLTINTAGGLATALNFASAGSTLNNFTVNVGSGNSVALSSNLTVTGTLSLGAGNNLNITGYTLTAAGNITGSGTFVVNSASSLILSSNANVSAALSFSGNIGAFTMNTGGTHTVMLGSNMTVSGLTTLQSGALVLNGYNLALNGNFAAAGTGTITSTSASDISLSGSSGTTGALHFTGTSNSVNNFMVAVGAANHASIGDTLHVMGTLNLSSGSLNFSGANLIVNGAVTGSGSLSGDTASSLIINTAGGLSSGLNFAGGGQTVGNFTVNVGSGNSVALSSTLAVTNTLSLVNGSNLNVSGVTFTLSGGISGTGNLMVNSGTNLVFNSTTGMSNAVSFSGTPGSLTINVGAGHTVTLGSNLTVGSMLYIQSGVLALNGHNLTITGDINASSAGTISSSVSSNITVNSTTSPAGSLNFTPSANVVGDFTVNVGGGGSISLASNLVVGGTLNFMAGHLNIASYDLQIATSGSVTGNSANAYVIEGTGGTVTMSLVAGSTTPSIFPVGTSSHYFPATVALNSGSPNGTVSVNVAQGVMLNGTSGTDISATRSMVAATWNIQSSITANLDMNLVLLWTAAAEVNSFDRTKAYISHYTASSWDVSAIAAANTPAGGMYSLNRDHITSLSPFAVFDQSTFTGTRYINDPVVFEVYPNPSSDRLFIEDTSFNTEDHLWIQIITITGRIVVTYEATDRKTMISLDGIAPGNYFVKIFNDRRNDIRKFTKI